MELRTETMWKGWLRFVYLLVMSIAMLSSPGNGHAMVADEMKIDRGTSGSSSPVAIRLRAERILALIDGTLEPSVDAASLFVLDLTDVAIVGADGHQFELMLRELDAKPGSPYRAPTTHPRSDRGPRAQSREAVDVLRAAYVEFLSLPDARRASLLAAHAQQQREAEMLQPSTTELRSPISEVDVFLDESDVSARRVEPSPLLALDQFRVQRAPLTAPPTLETSNSWGLGKWLLSVFAALVIVDGLVTGSWNRPRSGSNKF